MAKCLHRSKRRLRIITYIANGERGGGGGVSGGDMGGSENVGTIGENIRTDYTGVCDNEAREMKVGDTVSLFGMIGTVVFECGAYGIGFTETIDWDVLERKIPEITGCNNIPCFCYNDNFISFWELLWNFNCEDDLCCVVELLRQDGG